MTEINFESLNNQVAEVSRFFNFGKQKIVSSIKETLLMVEGQISKYEETRNDLVDLNTKHDEVVGLHDALSLQHQALSQSHEKLSNQHQTIETKYNLINQILSSKATFNEAMNEFNHLVENDFMNFANEESSLAEEAQTIIMLQNIQKELQIISNFPSVYNKNIVAVGGGFSAGKSEFISSFFSNTSIRLPIGIKPVTAIPAYITKGENHCIKGFSAKGGTVNIETDFYAKLSHDFIKSFNFNLKDIMPMLLIETEIDKYNHICFVDTPGYNPAATDAYTASDYKTSFEYLENANVLLWVVGLDASDGAFPLSDLKFLEELSLKDKKLFIIANKADLKSPDDIEDILDNLQETLDDYDIEYCGISAFSSVKKTELNFRKKSLLELLDEIDTPMNIKSKIVTDLETIFEMYHVAISEQITWTQNVQSNFHSLELDLMQSGLDMDNEMVYNRLQHIRSFFDSNSLKSQLKTLSSLRESFKNSVDKIFESMN